LENVFLFVHLLYRQNKQARAALTRQRALCCTQLLLNWRLRLLNIVLCSLNMLVRRKLHQIHSLQVWLMPTHC